MAAVSSRARARASSRKVKVHRLRGVTAHLSWCHPPVQSLTHRRRIKFLRRSLVQKKRSERRFSVRRAWRPRVFRWSLPQQQAGGVHIEMCVWGGGARILSLCLAQDKSKLKWFYWFCWCWVGVIFCLAKHSPLCKAAVVYAACSRIDAYLSSKTAGHSLVYIVKQKIVFKIIAAHSLKM